MGSGAGLSSGASSLEHTHLELGLELELGWVRVGHVTDDPTHIYMRGGVAIQRVLAYISAHLSIRILSISAMPRARAATRANLMRVGVRVGVRDRVEVRVRVKVRDRDRVRVAARELEAQRGEHRQVGRPAQG